VIADWLTQSVDVPLWGVLALSAYSGRRLATAVGVVDRLGGRQSDDRKET
jgi:hypothetical protein